MSPPRPAHLALLWLALALTLLAAAPTAAHAAPADQAPRRFLPSPPRKMTLCGEPVPLNLPLVAEQFDREFTIHVHDQAQVVMWMKRAARYFPYIEKQLKAAGLPDDLKYLAVAESSLLRRVRSYAGAVGPWQFVADTGRRYGLRRNRYFDDRFNLEKATLAAIAYLKDLHQKFGSWPLAMAAYNCGEKRLMREIREQGVSDYYHLYLPLETMRYVYRILAVKAILSHPERYGYHLPPSRLYRPIRADRVVLKLNRPLHLRTLARAARTTVRMLKELNPELRGYYLPRGRHRLKVPLGQAKGLSARLKRLKPVPPPRQQEWLVKPGDTLSFIARQTGVKVRDLMRANHLRRSLLHPGQRLVIPSR